MTTVTLLGHYCKPVSLLRSSESLSLTLKGFPFSLKVVQTTVRRGWYTVARAYFFRQAKRGCFINYTVTGRRFV